MFKNDYDEIKDILLAFFEASQSESSADSAIDNITAQIDEQYLMERAAYVKENARNDKVFSSLLSKLYTEYCCHDKCDDCLVAKYCNTSIAEKRANIDKTAPTMIDLFCGAGGLSLGFTQEGFLTSLANDIEPCCIDTYSHNHPETPRKHIVLGDIEEVVDNIAVLMRFSDIDVIVGGPPCQGFSMANRQRLIDDPRNHLYKSYVRAVEIARPRFFVMENVRGMLTVAPQVVEDFAKIGYTVSYKVLNAKEYGVPQNRERLIYIGNRIGVDNAKIIEEIEKSKVQFPQYVLGDAIYGLKPLRASRTKNDTTSNDPETGSKIARATEAKTNAYIELINQGKNYPLVFNHKARYNNDRDIEIFGRLNPGDNSNDPKIADIMPYTRRNGIFKDKYFKLEEDKVSKTITAHMKFDCNMYIHPTQARGLTPREAARIQSYPDDYFFRGAYTKTYMQIGNSVPPLLGRAIANIIKQYLKGE